MERKPGATDAQTSARAARVTIFVLCLALAAFIAVPACKSYARMSEARLMLTEAKGVELAVAAVAAEMRADGEKIYDPTSPNGFTPDALGRIYGTARCAGEVYMLQWDDENCRPAALLYTENGLCAKLVRTAEDGGSWSVYAFDPLIAP